MISLVTACYGDYWDRFSEGFFNSLAQCDPQPHEVIIVTDVSRQTANAYNIVAPGSMASMFNAGCSAASGEWVWVTGFDDQFLPPAFTPFHTDADAFLFPMMMDGQIRKYDGGYERMWELHDDPMHGGFMHRRTLLEGMPWRDLPFPDWSLFSEMAYHGKTIATDPMPRSIWVRHEDAHCTVGPEEWYDRHRAFNERLGAGLVGLGVPE